jgi:hypothetical protein
MINYLKKLIFGREQTQTQFPPSVPDNTSMPDNNVKVSDNNVKVSNFKIIKLCSISYNGEITEYYQIQKRVYRNDWKTIDSNSTNIYGQRIPLEFSTEEKALAVIQKLEEGNYYDVK